MYKNKKILALIPARGGSKGLPGKNIKELRGKPLIGWSIDHAKNSKYVDRVIVSTDATDIAEVSKKFGADVPFMRPSELATDTATSTDVILHCLSWIKDIEKMEYDCLILLQPTSPLRNSKHIDEAIEKFFSDDRARSLVSVTKVKKSPFWMRTVNKDGFLDNFLKDDKTYSRRQDLPDVFVLNGAIYLIRPKDFASCKGFSTPFTSFYEMDDHSSIDIDDKYDFILAETIAEKILGL